MNNKLLKISLLFISFGSFISYQVVNNKKTILSSSSSSSSSSTSSTSSASTSLPAMDTSSSFVDNHRSSFVDKLLKEQNINYESKNTFSLLLRKYEIFAIATRLFCDYKLVSWRCEQIDDSTEEGEKLINDIWDAAHIRNSKYLFNSFTKLAALWIKLGQYLSSRADVMPKPFLDTLSACQDSLPPIDFDEIKSTIESELGPVEGIFKRIDPTPLAVASIASVHRATLLDDREVVIKVQHSNVAEKLLLDLKCLEFIGETVKFFEPDWDFGPVVREWAREVPKELNFIKEKENMLRVAANLEPYYKNTQANLRFDVTIPKPIEEFVTAKVLVMEYIDGFKIDKKSLDEHSINREQVIKSITRAYGQMIFVDGFYQADNHPGNLLIQIKSREPVLLDFGLTKEVTQEIRLSFSKMLISSDEGDINGLLDSLQAIGLKLRTDVPFDISLLSKYFFRDAKPAEEAKEENKKRREDWKKNEELKKKTLYIADKIDVINRNIIGIKSTKKGEICEVLNDSKLKVRYTTGEEEIVSSENCLSASLDVKNSYFEQLTPYARLSLKRHYDKGVDSSQLNVNVQVDQIGLSDTIHEMIKNDEILGCQVCVIKNKKVITNICAGVLDPYEREPTKLNSIFNCFSVTKAIASTALLLMVDDGTIDLNMPVKHYWNDFKNEIITVQDVLNHKAGLHHACSSELAENPFLACDTDTMMKIIAESESEDYGSLNYHYLSYGWILQGICRSVTGIYLEEYIESKISSKLSISNEFMIGTKNLKDNSDYKNIATLVLKKFEISEQKSTKTSDAATSNSKRPQSSSLLLNPTFFNNPRIRESSIPSANGFFSAAALAKFYSALADNTLFKSKNGIMKYIDNSNNNNSKATIQSIQSEMIQGTESNMMQGFQIYKISETNDDICFGHSGVGGSIALTRINKKTGDNIQIAITLNRLSFDANVTRKIIRVINNKLKLKSPDQFLKE